MSVSITVPLTTIFTPPASCSSSWTYEGSYYNAISDGLLIQNQEASDFDSSCFPEGFYQGGRAINNQMVFSPGECPSGYSTAALTNGAATTTAVCCPTQFSFLQTFSSADYASSSIEYEGCTSMYPAGAGYTTVSARSGAEQFNITAVTGPITMWAQPITVEFQQADLTLFTTSTTDLSTTTTQQASTQQISTISSATQTSASSSTGVTSSSASLSGGAIAGIAIGCAAILGLLVGAAIFFRRRRTRSPSKQPEYSAYHEDKHPPSMQQASTQQYAELPGSKSGWNNGLHEVPAYEPVAQELDSDTFPKPRAELG